MQSFLSVRCSFFCYGHNSFIVFFPYFYHLCLYVSYFYQQENHPTQTFSTPVKISEKSTLDLKRLAHVIELDIPSKAIIHYPISSSFVLFGIISIFNDFFHTLLGALEDKSHRIHLPDVYVLYWIALVCTIIIRMDILFQAQTGMKTTFSYL